LTRPASNQSTYFIQKSYGVKSVFGLAALKGRVSALPPPRGRGRGEGERLVMVSKCAHGISSEIKISRLLVSFEVLLYQ
jgi:hypothetical protein